MISRPSLSDFEQLSKSKLPLDKLKGKTVLISGASGMIGGYLAEFLLYLNQSRNIGIKVMAMTRSEMKTKRKFEAYSRRPDLKLIIQDVVEPLVISGKVDFIIHAASQSSPKYFGSDPIGTMMPNVVGTKNLLEIARIKKSQGFLFISSGEVYGLLDKKQLPVAETDFGRVDSLSVRSCYCESKRLGETMCISWFAQHRVPITIARSFHIYGPGMDLDDARIFADFTRAIVMGEDLVINSDGSARRSFCYLADAVGAFLTILLLGKPGEAYNVGNSEQEVSVKQLANRLVKAFPQKKLKVIFDPKKVKKGYLPSSISRSYPDTSKLKKLGWQPRHTIEDGFRKTVASFT